MFMKLIIIVYEIDVYEINHKYKTKNSYLWSNLG